MALCKIVVDNMADFYVLWLLKFQISNVVEWRLANMFPCMEYVVRVGWLPDGNRSELCA